MSRPNERLENIFFYLTDSCNLRCKHCWVVARDAAAKESHDHEITIEQIRDVIDQAIPLGLRAIKLSGGEPLLRKDLREILEYTSNKDISTHVETNGMLLTPDIADLFSEHRVRVSVSLDGHDEVGHDAFRGVRGAFAKTLRGIRN